MQRICRIKLRQTVDLIVRKKKMGIKQEEFEAYNFVSKMVPRADGKINRFLVTTPRAKAPGLYGLKATM